MRDGLVRGEAGAVVGAIAIAATPMAAVYLVQLREPRLLVVRQMGQSVGSLRRLALLGLLQHLAWWEQVHYACAAAVVVFGLAMLPQPAQAGFRGDEGALRGACTGLAARTLAFHDNLYLLLEHVVLGLELRQNRLEVVDPRNEVWLFVLELLQFFPRALIDVLRLAVRGEERFVEVLLHLEVALCGLDLLLQLLVVRFDLLTILREYEGALLLQQLELVLVLLRFAAELLRLVQDEVAENVDGVLRAVDGLLFEQFGHLYDSVLRAVSLRRAVALKVGHLRLQVLRLLLGRSFLPAGVLQLL